MRSIHCAICGEDKSDVLFYKWGYPIVKCRRCDLSYVSPRSFRPETDDYFRGPYLSTIEEDGALKSDIHVLYSEIIRNLHTCLYPGHLLDVGCAMGHFMAFAREYGWTVHGVECSLYAADYGLKRWGLRIQADCDLRSAELSQEYCDACVLIEVAEHLPDPRVTFTEVFRLLKPGGLLYITTPNFASFRALLQRENWHAVIPTGHLYYFTAHSLSTLLRAIGFTRIIDLTAPAQFDVELGSIREGGGLSMDQDEIARIKHDAAVEDTNKPWNGRGEGLVLCASKPHSDRDLTMASIRYPGPTPMIDGKLVRVPGNSLEEQKVYLVRHGRKHWVVTVEWLHKHGMRLEDTLEVSREVLDSIFLGPPLG